jgi:dTDP-4-amino-4,6-dideoxygalactose transaminase
MEMIDNDRIQLPQPQSETFHVYHQFVLRVPREKRGDFIAYMTKNNVETRIIYETPIHMSGIYKTEDALPATEKIIKEIVALPIHHHLSNDQIWHIIDLINKWR